MNTKHSGAVRDMEREAREGAQESLTDGERAFLEGRPVKPMARVRCAVCNRWKFERIPCKCLGLARGYVPQVDGTLGSETEQERGGPGIVGGLTVSRERSFRVRLGDTGTVFPSGRRVRPDGEEDLTEAEIAEMESRDV